jgi:uncharacterized protein (DUF1778 family)
VGKPAIKNPKSKFISVRVTDRDYAMIQRASIFSGMSVSNFARGNLVTAAATVSSADPAKS